MEVYSCLLDLEVMKLPESQTSFETCFKESMLRNAYLLRMYSKQFHNTSRQMFPFKIRRFVLQARNNNASLFKDPPRRRSAPISPALLIPSKPEKSNKRISNAAIKPDLECHAISSDRPQYRDNSTTKSIRDPANNLAKNEKQKAKLPVPVGEEKDRQLRKIMFQKIQSINNFRRLTMATEGEEGLERNEKSKLNIVWVGQNQNLFGDRIREYLSSKTKYSSSKLKNWISSNGSGGFKASLPDFFMHKHRAAIAAKSSTSHFFHLEGI